MEILRKISIEEISAVRVPANKHARATIMKRDEGDTTMTFTKADIDGQIDKLARAYADTHKVTKAVAYTKVLETAEGKDLYAKSLAAPATRPEKPAPAPLSNVQKAASTAGVSFEILAKKRFPDERTPDAIAKFLTTAEGRESYSEYLEEMADAGIC